MKFLHSMTEDDSVHMLRSAGSYVFERLTEHAPDGDNRQFSSKHLSAIVGDGFVSVDPTIAPPKFPNPVITEEHRLEYARTAAIPLYFMMMMHTIIFVGEELYFSAGKDSEHVFNAFAARGWFNEDIDGLILYRTILTGVGMEVFAS